MWSTKLSTGIISRYHGHLLNQRLTSGEILCWFGCCRSVKNEDWETWMSIYTVEYNKIKKAVEIHRRSLMTDNDDDDDNHDDTSSSSDAPFPEDGYMVFHNEDEWLVECKSMLEFNVTLPQWPINAEAYLNLAEKRQTKYDEVLNKIEKDHAQCSKTLTSIVKVVMGCSCALLAHYLWNIRAFMF